MKVSDENLRGVGYWGPSVRAAVVVGSLLVAVYALRESSVQKAKIAELQARVEATDGKRDPPSAATIVKYVTNGPGGVPKGAVGLVEDAGTSAAGDGPGRPHEPTEEERRQEQEARVGRMMALYEAEPLDSKAVDVSRELGNAINAALSSGAESQTGVQRTSVECRARACRMQIQYAPGAHLEVFDRAIHGAARGLQGRHPPMISRVTKPGASEGEVAGVYFFRWKSEQW